MRSYVKFFNRNNIEARVEVPGMASGFDLCSMLLFSRTSGVELNFGGGGGGGMLLGGGGGILLGGGGGISSGDEQINFLGAAIVGTSLAPTCDVSSRGI